MKLLTSSCIIATIAYIFKSFIHNLSLQISKSMSYEQITIVDICSPFNLFHRFNTTIHAEMTPCVLLPRGSQLTVWSSGANDDIHFGGNDNYFGGNDMWGKWWLGQMICTHIFAGCCSLIASAQLLISPFSPHSVPTLCTLNVLSCVDSYGTFSYHILVCKLCACFCIAICSIM